MAYLELTIGMFPHRECLIKELVCPVIKVRDNEGGRVREKGREKQSPIQERSGSVC